VEFTRKGRGGRGGVVGDRRGGVFIEKEHHMQGGESKKK